MEDGIYRTAGYCCPTCRSPLREYQHRWICDECAGMLIGFDDFESACADLVGDSRLDIRDRAHSTTPCPLCTVAMQSCHIRVGTVKVKAKVSFCEKDGLWFGKGLLTDVFARLSSKSHRLTTGPYFDAGNHTRPIFAPGRRGSASDGLSIAEWRNRPRKRAHTLTPVNAYRDQKLRCPVCPDSTLDFMGDRFACAGCHGLFVENAAVEALVTDMIGEAWQIPAVAGEAGARRCPVCETDLVVEKVEGATIDRCAAHGLWFDPKELEEVLQHADAGHRPHGLIGWVRRLFG